MYRADGYVRLSRDEDKENYDSILNQKAVIYTYAQKHGIEIVNIYEDDNVSGYIFDRPGFNKLKSSLEDKNIDIIIAKDLSRIGRHNALTLLFLEQVKNAGKRLILTDEMSGGYDSSKDDDDIIGIKTWYNERYVKDISRKIRSTLREKQEKGMLLIRPPFGYSIDKSLNKFVIDEEKAHVVRDIFRLYQEGNGYRKIAEYLNDRSCITPSQAVNEYYESMGRKFKNTVSEIWSSTHVARILKDDAYIGNLRQGKTKKPLIKSKSIRTRPDEQLLFENQHEPIISKEDFLFVQQKMNERDKVKYRGTGMGSTRNMNVFSGMLFCAECGSYMTAHTPKPNKKAYVCSTYHRRGVKYCSSHRIPEEKLLNYIKNHLVFIRNNLYSFINSLNKDVEYKLRKEKGQSNLLDSLEKRLEVLNKEYKELLSQKIKDIVKNPDFKDTIESTYREMENEKLQRITSLTGQVESIKQMKENVISLEEKTKNAISIFNAIIEAEKPSRYNLELIIRRILVCEDHNVEILLNEDIDNLCQYQMAAESSLFIV